MVLAFFGLEAYSYCVFRLWGLRRPKCLEGNVYNPRMTLNDLACTMGNRLISALMMGCGECGGRWKVLLSIGVAKFGVFLH